MPRKKYSQHNGCGFRHPRNLPPVETILEWADAYHRQTGEWPKLSSGPIPQAPGESWKTLDKTLRAATRHLPRSSSLARLLKKHRGARNNRDLPPLSEKKILSWVDAFHKKTGSWPNRFSGPIEGAPGESWLAVNASLYTGQRGLPGGSSLARFLSRYRNVRNQKELPPLWEASVLRWIDAFHKRTGRWPTKTDGVIPETSGDTWQSVHWALVNGKRRLKGNSSLASFLEKHRGVRNSSTLPRITNEQVLAWADAYYQRTGSWPKLLSGPIAESPQETWQKVDGAMRAGSRGFPGGSSLAQFLQEHRGVRNVAALPSLTIDQILAWADAYHQQHHCWPTAKSKHPVPGAPDESWNAINASLRAGSRGLEGNLSLARVLVMHRGKRDLLDLPKLRIPRIIKWARAHYRRTGKWPNYLSGDITGSQGETWLAVNLALLRGTRGLPGGLTLARLLDTHCRS